MQALHAHVANLDASAWRKAASSSLSLYHPALNSDDPAVIKQALGRTMQVHSNLARGNSRLVGKVFTDLGVYLSPCATALAAVFADPSGRDNFSQQHHQIVVYTAGAQLQSCCSVNLRGLQRLQGAERLDTKVAWSTDSKRLVVVADGLHGSVLVCHVDAFDGSITNSFSVPYRPQLPYTGSQAMRYPYFQLSANGSLLLVQHKSNLPHIEVWHATGQILMITEVIGRFWNVQLGESFLAYELPGDQGLAVVNLSTQQRAFANQFVHAVLNTSWQGIEPRFAVSHEKNGPRRILSLSMHFFGYVPSDVDLSACSISPDMMMHDKYGKLEASDCLSASSSEGNSEEGSDEWEYVSHEVRSQDGKSLFDLSGLLPAFENRDKVRLNLSWSPDSCFAAVHQRVTDIWIWDEPLPGVACELHVLNAATGQLQWCQGIREWIDGVGWSRDGSTMVITAFEHAWDARMQMSILTAFVMVYRLC